VLLLWQVGNLGPGPRCGGALTLDFFFPRLRHGSFLINKMPNRIG
jgi:hypothetical protein